MTSLTAIFYQGAVEEVVTGDVGSNFQPPMLKCVNRRKIDKEEIQKKP